MMSRNSNLSLQEIEMWEKEGLFTCDEIEQLKKSLLIPTTNLPDVISGGE